MMPPLDPVQGDTDLPAQADVAIIGGGIAGVSAAWFLAKKGLSVVLLEKGQVAAEQSGRNWGWVRRQNRDIRELPLMRHSMELWDSLARETGADLGFRRTGLVYVTRSEAELAGWENWLEKARPWQVPSRMIGPEQARALTPGNEQDWIGGVHAPEDGRAEPAMAAPALATAARGLGVRILQGCAVRGLDITGGRVSGVITERGRIAADRVLCAAGAWPRCSAAGTASTCRRRACAPPCSPPPRPPR
jgi:glycine/D-amino acid oxidase-like deaminating enzyme